jgi:hypothetical protein
LERGRWGVAARVVVVGCKNLRKVEMGGQPKETRRGRAVAKTRDKRGAVASRKTRGRGG